MTNNRYAIAAVVSALLLAAVSMGLASGSKDEKKGKSRFLIEATHTPEECLRALDDMSAKSSSLLSQFDWGCKAGEHTGYAVIEAKSLAEVKSMLPASMQYAHIVKLNKFTAKEIKDLHQKQVGALDRDLVDDD